MLRIAACASWHAPLAEAPADLKAPLREALGVAPRRINRFIELALLGVARCRASSDGIPADAALVLASDTGMCADTARIVAGLPEGRAPTPFEFMNVSGAMAGFHIAQQLALHGPNLTLHASHAGLESGLALAGLASAPQRRALLGCVEEGGWPLPDHQRRLDWNGALAESSHWLYLDADAPRPRATIEACTRHASLDAMAASLAGVERAGLALCGVRRSRNDAPVESWMRALGITQRFEPLEAPCHSAGLPALAVCRFVERAVTGTLLVVNQVREDEFRATRVRVP